MFTSLFEVIQPITITFNVLSTILSEDKWTFETSERFLERFLRLMTFTEMQTLKMVISLTIISKDILKFVCIL